ncbi:MAG: hypothetical protein PHU71_02525 [Candidatus Gracilibacteria bacterium]|nr:hypothetical protein [Candidatus Gracilibacteria bacterium]
MRETPDENREKSLQDFETFIRGQVHAYTCDPYAEVLTSQTVMGFYGKKVDPDEVLEFLQDDETWKMLTSELNSIPDQIGVFVRASWASLRKGLIEDFRVRSNWKRLKGSVRTKIKNLKNFLGIN